MSIQIFDLKFGINHCYVIKDKNVIMIDGGSPNIKEHFKKKLTNYSINPEEISLIILTHGDFDHVGSAKDIQEITGAQLAIHQKDRMNLESGLFNWPKGVTTWGKISRSIFFPLIKNKMNFPKVKANIVLDNNELSLKDYGIAGKVIYTPGHTLGSVSVLLDTGEAFVGCLAHNNIPFRLKPGLPIFAENIELIKESWKLLVDKGAKMIYPAHGKPFSVEIIKKYII